MAAGDARDPNAAHVSGAKGAALSDAETLPLDPCHETSPEHVKFQRGRAAIALLEAIRFSHPEQLADLAADPRSIDGNDVPRSIGRFQILRELGRGGHGVVLLAHDPRLNRRVALKVPRPEALVTPDLRRRFLREAEAAGALNHPNIVPIYEQGTVGPLCFVACGYCDGPSLAQWLANRAEPVSIRQAVQIVRALADAVQHAHSRGVLHRDLKPANVLLEDGSNEPGTHGNAASLPMPRIIDFGLARIEGNSGHTATTAIVGTPAFMSPEQAAGRNDLVGCPADIYGLGTILYQLLTGELPFCGQSDLEVLQAVQFQEPTAPRRLRPEIPRDLEAICLKCLEKQPEQRFSTAAHLYADLGRFLDGDAVEARPIGSQERLRRWVRRNPALALVTGIAIALFLVGSASVFWQWRRAEGNLKFARDQQERAVRHLHSAQQAVDELLTDLATEMQDLPQTEAIRERLLKRAAMINQRFLQDESVDPDEAKLQSVLAWYRAGDIAFQLGNFEEAESAFQRVVLLCQSAPDNEPLGDMLTKHVSALCRLSGIATKRNNVQASGQYLHDGLRFLEQLNPEFVPERDVWRAELLRSLGMNAESQGDLNQAGQFYSGAIDLIRRKPPADEEKSPLTLVRIKVHNSYAIHCKQKLRVDEAAEHYEASRKLLVQLREQSSDSAEVQSMLGVNHYNLANLVMVEERFAEAREKYLAAKNEFKQLAARFPQVVSYKDLWCHSLMGAALASKGPDMLDKRIFLFRKAAFLREEIRRDCPDLTSNTSELVKVYRNLGKEYVRAKNYDEARQCFRRAMDASPGPGVSQELLAEDRLDDAWTCSLLAHLEMNCENWEKALKWYELAISKRSSGKMRPRDIVDQLRDQAGLGVAEVRVGRVADGLRRIHDLPRSNTNMLEADRVAADALLTVSQIQLGASSDTPLASPMELKLEAIERLSSAWLAGDNEAHAWATSESAQALQGIPQFDALVAEMESSSGASPVPSR